MGLNCSRVHVAVVRWLMHRCWWFIGCTCWCSDNAEQSSVSADLCRRERSTKSAAWAEWGICQHTGGRGRWAWKPTSAWSMEWLQGLYCNCTKIPLLLSNSCGVMWSLSLCFLLCYLRRIGDWAPNFVMVRSPVTLVWLWLWYIGLQVKG